MPAKRRGGPTPKITEAVWEQVLTFYAVNIDTKDKHAAAAKQFRFARHTMSKLWFKGCPHLNKPPLKELMNSVEVRARAARAKAKQEELAAAEEKIQEIIKSPGDADRRLAAADAVETRMQEGAMVVAARKSNIMLQALMAEMSALLHARLPDLKDELGKAKPSELIRIARDLTSISKELADTAKKTMEMERILLGSPDDSARGVGTGDPVAARKILDLAVRTAKRFEDEPMIVIPADGETMRASVDGEEDESQDESDYEDGDWEDDGDDADSDGSDGEDDTDEDFLDAEYDAADDDESDAISVED